MIKLVLNLDCKKFAWHKIIRHQNMVYYSEPNAYFIDVKHILGNLSLNTIERDLYQRQIVIYSKDRKKNRTLFYQKHDSNNFEYKI